MKQNLIHFSLNAITIHLESNLKNETKKVMYFQTLNAHGSMAPT